MKRIMLLSLLALALPTARADTIKDFVVSGTAQNMSGGTLDSCAALAFCSFSGALTIDVTSGMIDAVRVNFPGLSAFNTLHAASGPVPPNFALLASNVSNDQLFLFFTTPGSASPGSLVGFNGGSITGVNVTREMTTLYSTIRGDITPVPEPSSLELLGTSLLSWLGFGLVWSRSKAALI